MNYIITTHEKLQAIIPEMRFLIDKDKALTLTFEEIKRSKTKKQLGFVFGMIITAFQQFYYDNWGETYSKEFVKDILYEEIGIKSSYTLCDGREITVLKRISNMSKDEMSEFIQRLIEYADELGVVLPPEAHTLWINHLSNEYINEISQLKLPQKDNEYLVHVRKQHCLICAKLGCEAHHFKLYEGLSEKPPDWQAVSLCPDCHRNHNGGHISSDAIISKCRHIFERIEPKTFLKLLYYRWKRKSY